MININDTDYQQSGTEGCVTIQKNTCGPNSWSFSVNSSGWQSGYYNVPKKYDTIVWTRPNQLPFNETYFWVYPDCAQLLTGDVGHKEGLLFRRGRLLDRHCGWTF